jgi:hypothetical protein
VYEFVARDGRGAATYPNKDRYEGDFCGGKKHGEGLYVFANGAQYRGAYVNGRREGHGVFTAPDGGSYDGQWKNDQRHGHGIYTYPSRDKYIGSWVNGMKHGKGTYVFGDSQQQLSGVWVEGRCQSGTWTTHDGSRFVGSFTANKPNGEGAFFFANGLVAVGEFVGGEWEPQPFARPPPDAVPPKPQSAPPLVQLSRAVGRAVLRLDHFAGAERLPRTHEGCPNLRQIKGGLPVFGCGQPATHALEAVVKGLAEQGLDKVVWLSVRQEPVIYLGAAPAAPRDPRRLAEPLLFAGVTPEEVDRLQAELAQRVRRAFRVERRVAAWAAVGDAWVEHPLDARSEERALELASEQEVRTLPEVMAAAAEEKELPLEFRRAPLPAEGAPSAAEFDRLLSAIKEAPQGAALVFSGHLGGARTTLAMVAAALWMQASKGGAGAEEAKKEETAEEAEEAEDAEEQEEEEEENNEDDDDENSKKKKKKKKQKQKKQEKKAKAAPAAPAAAPVADPEAHRKAGFYAVIEALVQTLPDGRKAKEEVDAAIDKAEALVNLRAAIWDAKARFEADEEPRKAFWKRQAASLLECYFMLICFHHYLRTAGAQPDSDKSFAQWCQENAAALQLLGTRDAGALASFAWA